MAPLLCAWSLHISSLPYLPFLCQVAVAQYSEEPRAAFHFNQHQDRNSALKAIKELHYTGGNTKTGLQVKPACGIESYGPKFCKIWQQTVEFGFIPRDGLSNQPGVLYLCPSFATGFLFVFL